MWNGDNRGLCNCHEYRSRYEGWKFSNVSRHKARSRSPCNNSTHGKQTVKCKKWEDSNCGLREQHLRLKRAFQELKRDHENQREIWEEEKKALVKEIAEINAGENRGILLELKAVLEVIQKEQRKEEKKWSDFLLQFLNDQCGRELEGTELRHRISQLYQEVKLRRENNLNEEDKGIQGKVVPSFSVPFSNLESIAPGITARQVKHCTVINNSTDTSNRTSPNICHNLKMEKTPEMESVKCLDQKMSKTDNDTLNDALREIARVSEELCKYQEEIRKKSLCKRLGSVSSKGDRREAENKHLKPDSITASRSKHVLNKNNLKNTKNMEDTVCKSFSERSDIVDVSLEIENSLLPPWCLPWQLTSSLFPEINNTSLPGGNKICHHPFSTSEKKDMVFNSADVTGDKNFDGLCHFEVLCDTLEKRNMADTILNNFMDNNLNLETDRQYGSTYISGLHSCLGPVSNCDNTIKNGTLAAKIDEFNRIVFKTDKGKAVFNEPSLDLPKTGNEEQCKHSLCDCPSTVNFSPKPYTVIEDKKMSLEDSTLQKTCMNVRATIQQSQATGIHSTSSYQNMLQGHNWKPSNLSGRPRSADSRSNYRVVENLLKSYENKFASPSCNSTYSASKSTESHFLLTDTGTEALTQCLEMLQVKKTKDLQQDISINWQPGQDALSLKLPEMSLLGTSSNGKGFSRPARPANRRPPSRWAPSQRSPSMPSAIKRTAN
ncbi:uncharacterized protein KIAA0408 homolog isoform X2 [Spea bombifrons]|uniref:uncharacterized protein KIAA0408 homolog isoform X2 n=1 Tax=Spea bombifrons TaxID=233779 RepID=UPI00234935D1|nr:uncharacterized protein KIAA0408 homolog isoform X2 [Spea bombifrons]